MSTTRNPLARNIADILGFANNRLNEDSWGVGTGTNMDPMQFLLSSWGGNIADGPALQPEIYLERNNSHCK